MQGKPPAAGSNDKTQEFTGPVAGYEVIETKPEAAGNRFIAAEMYGAEERSDEEPEAAFESEADVEAPAAPAPVTVEPENVAEAEEQEDKRPGKPIDRKRLFVLAGAGLGLVLILVLWLVIGGKSADSYDLGPVMDTATGLSGHLLTEWNGRLNYKVALEPGDPSQLAHFRNAVNASAQPLAVEVQIKDPMGAVLCRSMVLLRFDPLKNLPPAVAADGKKMTADELDRAQAEQALNNARLVSQELTREHGNDMFSNVNGPDGQVESLSAQGTLPCTRKQYDHAASWGFTTNFPPLGSDDNAAPAAPLKNAQTASGAAAKRRKPAAPVSHFSIEEDDVAVSYQASSGVLETRDGRKLLVDRKGALASVLKSADLPLRIHFRCDQFGACMLAAGGSVQRAMLQR